MEPAIKPQIYVSHLSKAEKAEALKLAAAFPEAGLREKLRDTIQNVAVDRLILAEECLKVAKDLEATAKGGEKRLRAAVSRAYYSIHHSVRAMVLWCNQWEADGHTASSEELKTLLEGKGFRDQAGLAKSVYGDIAEARDNREVGDYSPYAISRKPDRVDWVTITGNNWNDAVKLNITLAEGMLRAAERVVDVGGS